MKRVDFEFYRDWYPEIKDLSDGEIVSHWRASNNLTRHVRNIFGVRHRGNGKRTHSSFSDLAESLNLSVSNIPNDFDWKKYILLNSDLPQSWSRWHAMLHYLQYGIAEQRSYREQGFSEVGAFVEFNADWYAKIYNLADEQQPVRHYQEVGRANLLAPNAEFSPISYWKFNPDVAHTLTDPLLHYVSHGHGERREFSRADISFEKSRNIYSPEEIGAARQFFQFNSDFYLENRPDLKNAGVDPFEHYLVFGEAERAQPSRFFDPSYYKEKYSSSLERWPHSALEHFLSIGMLTGHFPSQAVAAGARRLNYHTAIEWVRHWLGLSEPAQGKKELHPLESEGGYAEAKYEKSAKSAGTKTLNWVIPLFSKGGGGHTTIFRCARTLARLGWKSVFWIDDATNSAQIDALYSEYIGHFPSTNVSFRLMESGFKSIENEFLIATAWTTVYTVAKNVKSNVRLYFLQDRESLFLPAGTDALRAEYTFKMGLDFVCAGNWLESLISDQEGDHTHFELCAESVFQKKDPKLEERDILAVIYVRGHTNRRCSDLMIDVANRLSRLGMGEVVIFGDDEPGPRVSSAVTNAGILSVQQMAELFQRAKFGLAASATNYSILPVELAAAGTIVIQPRSESTQKTTDIHGAISVAPTSEAVVGKILSLAKNLDQSKFDQLRSEYTNFARSISWESEFEKLSSWLDEKLNPNHRGAPAVVVKKSVGVVIPTYYPDMDFEGVVEAIHGQLTSYKTEIQIVDTRKGGEVSPVIEKIESLGLAKVHAIDVSQFQHGDTRNLGAELHQADYYAYLTQDALPATEYWLESLVSPLAMLPDCGYSFGAHRAYPQHHPIYDYDLSQHFGNIGMQFGILTDRRRWGDRYQSDQFFRAGLCFNSDNNAAYRGDLLRHYRFPSVEFAEDQGIAKRLLDAGYSRAYCPGAVVFHSHDYTSNPTESFKRGTEEAEALFQNFGIVRFSSVKDYLYSIRHVERAVMMDAAQLGLAQSDCAGIIEAKKKYIDGLWFVSRNLLEKRDTMEM
ncbi:hypothetical protein [Burkholderia seminalis]|uniref:rhamnosyltransferase WsaF family glycosyltransferase n=1 Tax=Burkholderia seminalis TaxID=488731 RepID=UPI000ACF29A5|nr:hypothetical protein [Burkholderia seminalis]